MQVRHSRHAGRLFIFLIRSSTYESYVIQVLLPVFIHFNCFSSSLITNNNWAICLGTDTRETPENNNE